MIQEYRIIMNNDIGEFVDKVSEALANSWKCQGGLVISLYRDEEWFYQAIVKEVEIEEEK